MAVVTVDEHDVFFMWLFFFLTHLRQRKRSIRNEKERENAVDMSVVVTGVKCDIVFFFFSAQENSSKEWRGKGEAAVEMAFAVTKIKRDIFSTRDYIF